MTVCSGRQEVLVRERRHDMRLSQAKLANRAGVGREWLVAVEKGHPRAELGKLLALLAELGLNLDVWPGGPPVADSDQQHVDLDVLLRDFDDGAS